MAAFNKLGGLLRRSALVSSASTGSTPAMFNAARLMSSKVFVGGLSWNTNDQGLRDAFSGFGEVTEARVITDRETGRSRGFGFVSFISGEDAQTAISHMDNKELDGRTIRVNIANERPPNRGFGGGGGFGGGQGYDNNGYGRASGDGY